MSKANVRYTQGLSPSETDGPGPKVAGYLGKGHQEPGACSQVLQDSHQDFYFIF